MADSGERTGAHGVSAVFAQIGYASVRFRWLVVIAWPVLAVALNLWLPSLGSQVTTDNSSFLPKSEPSIQAAALASPFQPEFSSSALIVAGGASPLTAVDQAAIGRAEAAVARLPGVLAVRDQGVSADGRARQAEVEIAGHFSSDSGAGLVRRIRQVLHDSVPSSLPVHLTGDLATQVDIQSASSKTNSNTELYSIIFIIVLLLAVFRAVLAPIVTLLPAAIALIVAQPLIAGLAKRGVLSVSTLTEVLLIVIVLGAGTDYGLFLIFRVREEIAAGRGPHEAVTRALTRVGETITFSAACVAVALLSLLLAQFGFYRGLGPGLAIGIAIVLLCGLTLLPALLAIFGRAVFWPRPPRAGSVHRGLWGDLASRAVARPKLTLVAGLVVFGGLALATLAYTPAGFGGTTSPARSDSARGQAVLQAHFPAASANPTNLLFKLPRPVWSDPGVLVTGSRALAARTGVFRSIAGPLDPNGTPLSPARLVALRRRLGPALALPVVEPAGAAVSPPLYQAYRATAQFISRDGRTVQCYATLTAGNPGGTPAMNAIPRIRLAVAAVARRIGAVRNGVGGEAAALHDVSSTSSADLVRIVPVVLIVIGLLLALMLRSAVAPIYLVASVALSYLAALGLAIIAFVEIGGDPGLNFVLPFFMFVFLMALGSDYNILVMGRIREEAHRLPLTAAVRAAVQATGTTVTSAGLILAGTFCVLTISGTGQVREIGLGLAAGVLLDTFLVRTLLIPSTVALLGRRNWWPSQLEVDQPEPEATATT